MSKCASTPFSARLELFLSIGLIKRVPSSRCDIPFDPSSLPLPACSSILREGSHPQSQHWTQKRDWLGSADSYRLSTSSRSAFICTLCVMINRSSTCMWGHRFLQKRGNHEISCYKYLNEGSKRCWPDYVSMPVLIIRILINLYSISCHKQDTCVISSGHCQYSTVTSVFL